MASVRLVLYDRALCLSLRPYFMPAAFIVDLCSSQHYGRQWTWWMGEVGLLQSLHSKSGHKTSLRTFVCVVTSHCFKWNTRSPELKISGECFMGNCIVFCWKQEHITDTLNRRITTCALIISSSKGAAVWHFNKEETNVLPLFDQIWIPTASLKC